MARKSSNAEVHLYQQIAARVRQDVLEGRLRPGERLPSVREMAARWNCTLNTVQRAYQELARLGLVTARAGQGTHITGDLAPLAAAARQATPLRKANLVNRAEAFLLEVLTEGHAISEVEEAFSLALDRWRVLEKSAQPPAERTLRCVGSHDLVVVWLGGHFREIAPGWRLDTSFAGSLGGLIALAEGQAEMAGCHLWDAESGEYNLPFVRRLLPGQVVALVGISHRRQGWISLPGAPQPDSLEALVQPGVRFANRQPGSGTRVWLDAKLQRAGIDPQHINGYTQAYGTHSEVARAVAEGRATLGLGLEAAAQAFGLAFTPLLRERYELAIPAPVFHSEPVPALVSWLQSEQAREVISQLGGYETDITGEVRWSA